MRRYELKGMIGEGASSTVYRGVSCDGDEVAVKVMMKKERGARMMYKEIKMLNDIEHENVVKMVDRFESSGHVYVVEELCDSNLVSFLNEYEVDEDIALKILRMILCGVRCIHMKGIIHRDIKLGNILLKGNTVKICDFGLSCYSHESGNSLCGTMDYIAPEMTDGREYSFGVDMWSVGVIFHVLLTKRKYDGCEDVDCSVESKDLLHRLLEKEMSKRISASEALQHKCFDRFIPEFNEYRDLPDFEIDTKYGRLRKMRYEVGLGDVKIGIQGLSGKGRRHGGNCSCDEKCVYLVFVGGRKVERRFLPNGELKILSVIVGYVRKFREKTAKIIIEEDGSKFYYMFSNDFVYVSHRLTLRRRNGKYEMRKEGGERSDNIPNVMYEKMGELSRRCESIDKDTCWFNRGSPMLIDCSSHQVFSISLSQVSEMNIRTQVIYDYIDGIGWSIWNGPSMMFLLIGGERMDVRYEEMVVEYDGAKYVIDDRLPLELKYNLKRVLPFLLRFLDGLCQV